MALAKSDCNERTRTKSITSTPVEGCHAVQACAHRHWVCTPTGLEKSAESRNPIKQQLRVAVWGTDHDLNQLPGWRLAWARQVCSAGRRPVNDQSKHEWWGGDHASEPRAPGEALLREA